MKEAEIRRREAHNRYLELVKEDLEHLLVDRFRFIVVDCPGCGRRDFVPQFEKAGFAYVLCQECETLFVNPRPVYQDLMRLYAEWESTRYCVEEFFRPMAEARREKVFRPSAGYVAGRFRHLPRRAKALQERAQLVSERDPLDDEVVACAHKSTQSPCEPSSGKRARSSPKRHRRYIKEHHRSRPSRQGFPGGG